MNKIIIIISCLFTALFSKAQITYTPQTASGYQFKYVKVDSGFAIPYLDTTIGRGIVRAGAIVCKPSDKKLYVYNGTKWVDVSTGGGAGPTNKVDSVTIIGNVLFYWINGTSVGVTLPVGYSQDFQQVTDNGNVTTNDISANHIYANASIATTQLFSSDHLIRTNTSNVYGDSLRGYITGDSIRTSNLRWNLPDTTGTFVLSINGVKADRKGNVSTLTLTPPGTDSSTTAGFGLTKTVAGNNIDLKVDSSQVATKYDLTLKQDILQADLPILIDSNVISIPMASLSTDGYLSATDYTDFFNKDTSKWSFNSGTDIYNKNSGNVGIGTSSPTKKLEVFGGDALINGLTVGRGGDGSNIRNVAIGNNALLVNTSTVHANIAIGPSVLSSLTTGISNVAIGYLSQWNNINGSANVAIGSNSMANHNTGFYNTAIGYEAMVSSSTGSNNVAIGRNATSNLSGTFSGSNNTHVGASGGKVLAGSDNVSLGSFVSVANPDSSNQLAIGNITGRWISGKNGNIGIGIDLPDSLLTVQQGLWSKRGVRFSGLPTSAGTKTLRIDGSGNLSVVDTTVGGGGTVTAIGVTTANGISGTSSGGATPNLTLTLGNITPTSVTATNTVTAPYLYGGDKTTSYGGYTGAILGGTATHGILDFWDNNARVGEFYTTSSSFNFFSDAGKDINFYVNNSFTNPAIGVLTNGNVGIGISTPSYKLDVAGTGNFSGNLTAANLTSGTYTPSVTNVANIAAATPYQCQYLRVGNTVTVSGQIDIDPNLTATATELRISLPITSNIAASQNLGGTGFCQSVTGLGLGISGDATNDAATFKFSSSDINNNTFNFTFTYTIL